MFGDYKVCDEIYLFVVLLSHIEYIQSQNSRNSLLLLQPLLQPENPPSHSAADYTLSSQVNENVTMGLIYFHQRLNAGCQHRVYSYTLSGKTDASLRISRFNSPWASRLSHSSWPTWSVSRVIYNLFLIHPLSFNWCDVTQVSGSRTARVTYSGLSLIGLSKIFHFVQPNICAVNGIHHNFLSPGATFPGQPPFLGN